MSFMETTKKEQDNNPNSTNAVGHANIVQVINTTIYVEFGS